MNNDADIIQRAGIPDSCPPILKPGQVEAIFRWTRYDREAVARVGALEPMKRDFGEHARYRKVDVARFILEFQQAAWWDEIDA